MEAVVENVQQNIVENVAQDNLAGPIISEPVVDQQIGGQAAQQIIETVSEIHSNIQPEMVRQAEEIVDQAVNQETFVTEVASQASSEVVTEAVTFVESVTERVEPPIVENVVETIVSESQPIIETASETFQTPEAPVVIEPQVSETVSEMVSDVVTEAQTEVTTLFTEDGSSTQSTLISKISTADYIQWAQETHLIMTISISMVYLFIILLIRRLLSKRSPFHLRSLMFLWNLIRVVLHIAQTVILVRLLAPVIKGKKCVPYIFQVRVLNLISNFDFVCTSNSLGVMWRERALLVILLLLLVQQICATKKQDHGCPLSSCGKITNITYPFRLKGHPKSCGDNRYELACENNVTVLHLYSGKYHVQAINYNNFTIRVVDPGVDQQTNCSSLPRYFLSRSNFTDTYNYRYNMDPYQAGEYSGRSNWDRLAFQHIVYMNCSNPVTQNGKYVDTASYVNWDSKDKYIYAIAGDLKAEDFQVGCHVKLVALTSWWGLDTNNYSYAAMHTGLVYGFEISWMRLICDQHCPSKHGCDDCFFDSVSQELNYWNGNSLWSDILATILPVLGDILVTILYTIFTLEALIMLWAWKILLTVPLFIVILTCKWRKRHLSMFESIENYLEQNNLMPIRYSYKEVKKMAGGFKDKLGEGGYGSVFKGKLRSGSCVAIKMLGKSKGNGQDFISEVATIGRTYHQNIVQLIGFCVHGSKRALVYEFMPNGSLDKFIFSKDESIHLSYDRIYNISIGVARGIAYLHYGCEMQILHFDIKPHNILLDENFTPKVSDFGLAKLYPIDNSIVPRTAARGTIGYMAPELFYNNIGGISHKADVYSYGMLLMEMAGKRKNLNPHAERSSQLFFPFWIYNHIRDGEDIEMEDVTKEEKKMVKKMIIVALWCIQLKPNDRPSMNEVVEMLEGDIENLEIPPKPTLYPSETITKN